MHEPFKNKQKKYLFSLIINIFKVVAMDEARLLIHSKALERGRARDSQEGQLFESTLN